MATPTPVNTRNVQGDILVGGLPKKTETFIFFQITDATKFIQDLVKLAPLIKTAEQILHDRDAIDKHKKDKKPGLVKLVGVNIALSYTGLHAMGISDDKLKGTALLPASGSLTFKNGAAADAPSLGDPLTADGKLDWDKEFLGQIDGVILVAGDSHKTVKDKVEEVEHVFDHGNHKSSIKVVKSIVGDVRPKDQDGHEHFGFQDGVSNPLIAGLDPVVPGPPPMDAKLFLTGHGDGVAPDWTTDGSLLVFRYLFQKVPEFDTFLKQHPLKTDTTGKELTPEEGSELFGARLVGRWKSGAPIDLEPDHDNKELADDPTRNNNFSFLGEFENNTRCPWAAHIRRTNPREDSTRGGLKPAALDGRRILRRGIAFGPEVGGDEHHSGKTKHGRGLLFACYQADIDRGFRFIQTAWANNKNFPFIGGDPPPNHVPGFDPLISQVAKDVPREMTGTDPLTANNADQVPVVVPQLIFPRGAGYFFSPSLATLKDFASLVTPAAPPAPAPTTT